MFKIVFWNVKVHMLRNENGQKGKGIKEKKVRRIARGYGHRAESEKESFVEEDRDILEERDRD
jgi:hypothetical protein